ncbi:MAG: YggT family protein [Pseudomonadales bacterium]|jgi:YggT family protein
MSSSLAVAGSYLIQTLFGLYVLAIMLRFLLQIARADFYNPVSQAIVKVTNPALRPLRRIIPGFGGLDISALLLALIVQMTAIALILLLHGYSLPNILLMAGWALTGLFALVLNIYFFTLIAVIILSWVAPHSRNPLATLVFQLVEPIMLPMRRIIPPLGGLDLSPIFIFILINLVRILVVGNLVELLGVPRGLMLGM